MISPAAMLTMKLVTLVTESRRGIPLRVHVCLNMCGVYDLQFLSFNSPELKEVLETAELLRQHAI